MTDHSPHHLLRACVLSVCGLTAAVGLLLAGFSRAVDRATTWPT